MSCLVSSWWLMKAEKEAHLGFTYSHNTHHHNGLHTRRLEQKARIFKMGFEPRLEAFIVWIACAWLWVVTIDLRKHAWMTFWECQMYVASGVRNLGLTETLPMKFKKKNNMVLAIAHIITDWVVGLWRNKKKNKPRKPALSTFSWGVQGARRFSLNMCLSLKRTEKRKW